MRFLTTTTFLILSLSIFAQNKHIESTLATRGEAVISIDTSDLKHIPNLESYSVDKIKGDRAYLYVNNKHYKNLITLGISTKVEPIPSLQRLVKMAHNTRDAKEWDSYPDWSTYQEMMEEFATNYPDICVLDTIGYSIENRIILALKISDNVSVDEDEPEVLYTSSMHGDELTGYVLTLRLADYLLSNYKNNSEISTLINNVEIYINPLSNPDGTFAGGESSVNGATRYNANRIDLNRNYPDPEDGVNPDGNNHQKENIAMMDFLSNRNFVMSMNFHGGAEVLNYPWDTWYENEHTHADADWFVHVCREYADTVHLYSNGYLDGFDNGITNGADWYSISGGRQDYVTYFLRGREITTELSDTKLPAASTMPNFWEYNYRSLINFLEQAMYGIHGNVTDTDGNPMPAKIEILDHDMDSSHVRTDEYGKFYRYLASGTYNLKVTSLEFDTTLTDIQVQQWEQLAINIGGGNFADPTSITISGEGELSEITTDGGTLQMVATLEPENANNLVTWSIAEEDKAFASISETGELTALENGVVTVKAISTVIETVMDEAEITISGQITLAINNKIRVNNESANIFTMYPNPVYDMLHIKNADTIEKIELVSLNGEVIISQENKATDKIIVDIQNLNSGVYFVRIYTTNKIEVTKIVKH